MSQLSRLARLRKRHARTLSQAQRRRRLVAGFEPLEDRRLLAITTSFAAGVLTFTGDTGVGIDDKVVLESTATPGTVNYDDGGGLGSTTQAGVNSVVFNGFSGKNEMIIINQGASAFRPFAGGSFGIQFNVNGDPDFDLLRISGGSAGTILSGSYMVSSATSGTISYTTTTTPINISFTGLDSTGLTPDEVSDETVQAGTFVTNSSAGAENVTVKVGPVLDAVQSFTQGPVFIDGGDRDDHGNSVGTPARWTISTFQDLETGGWNLGNDANIENSTTRPHVSITSIAGDNTSDFYRFSVGTANSLGTFDIDFTNGWDAYLAVFDSAGNPLTQQDDNGGDPGSISGLDSRIVNFNFPTAGNYFIGVDRCCPGAVVGGFPSSSGVPGGSNYTLHVSLANHALTGGPNPIAEVEPNHGFAPAGPATNQAGWKFIEQAVDFVGTGSFNPGTTTDVLIIGANGSQASAAIASALGALGYTSVTVTATAGPGSIATVDFDDYKLIYVPSSDINTGGGISQLQLNALNLRKIDIQNYVRSGGGIVALTEEGLATPYGWLELPLPFTVFDNFETEMFQTPALALAGFNITDAELTAGTPTHNAFSGPPGFNGLDIFVVDPQNEVITLGQGAINQTVGGGPTTQISGNQMTRINLGNKPSLTLNALGGTDNILVDGSVMSLDGLLAPIAINGGGNNDNLSITDSADAIGDAVSVTSLATNGLAAFPITYSGIGSLSVQATQGADTINVDVSPAAPGLGSVTVLGGLSGDLFTGPSGYMRPSPTIALQVHGGTAAATPGPGVPFNPFGEPGDKFNLDMTTRADGSPVLPVVIVDTNGGNAVSSNTQLVRFTGIENIDVLDGGVLTNTAIGDFYLRGVDGAPDYIEFRSAAQVDPTFRVRVGNTYYPSSTGQFGPYMTATGKVYVYGRGGNDTITMFNTRLDAVIFGEAGNDVITGGYGNDLLIGGQGDDRLNGANVGGNDEVWGDDFDPVLGVPSVASQAAGGNDHISTFGGNDTVYGQGGNEIINTGGGADYVNGGPGDDWINGQAGDDRLYGGSGIDNINGSDGHDLVAGNAGNDTLIGELGNDILIGGLGADTVNGGAGGDVVVGDESNNAGGSGSLAKNDIADAALLALLTAWGASPVLGSLGGFGSAGSDGSVDTLWGGTEADAFFNTATDVAADKNAFGYGPDL